MPRIMRQGLDKVKELLRSVKGILKEEPDTGQKLDEARRKLDKALEVMDRLPTLAASSLREPDVTDIFGLSYDKRSPEIWKIDERDLIPVPEALLSRIEEMEKVRGIHPINEATVRWRLDIILQYCVRLEQQRVADIDPTTSERPITLTAETQLECRIMYKKQPVLLSGKADYSIWYEDHGMSTNLVICEAKDLGHASIGIPQCLAYMGMVNDIRRREDRINSMVYGCVTDGQGFTFLRIDNDHKYSVWNSQRWDNGFPERDKIWTHLVRMTRCASALSPRTSVKKVHRAVDDTTRGQKHWRLHFGSSERSDEMMSM
ncbi:hypothetical protein C8Q69DRAFT_440608 [Paecilomyces variotii]|uniref:Fungal-type protein kinase domain-containing protein n=1 Tax=Byssochlamys spectabilis TaxID=264951 RepID=A0A443I652_BYSSP|nr:hypothetical protein C8Q69DRAFT_440608 [Paecilomyces variotii]KAJ9349639.1 hypothetical protein DTO280E4_8950 [Paecilomyces variotii]RWQ99517.1 hypothetical protein C8Q69DRAFT_440608 [Paecilomyces variotii]